MERRFDNCTVPEVRKQSGQEDPPFLSRLRVRGVVGEYEPPGPYARRNQLGIGGPVELPGDHLVSLGLRVHDRQCTTAGSGPLVWSGKGSRATPR